MDWYLVALLGSIGGVLPDVIKVVNKRTQGRPIYLTDGFYWISLGILALLGAVVAALKGAGDPIEALALGAAAPTLLTHALAQEQDAHLGVERSQSRITRIRQWWGA